ncbi:MAG: TIGR03986 family CRISPR-associated RAMP protein, partial [Campylobacterota bacterium]|nr:TIGR03986 family CRISPR-associated RAMP protein [Campylobacterota bacterium]
NFVPLSEKVFFPDWAEKVSHDVPFEDAQSGMIDITITAKSPIFIRNHSDDRDEQSTEFCKHNGEYYIPSTSVKGMVRSVLEIMSFSKMSQFDDNTYAVRDLSKADNFYMKQMNLIDEPFTQCGWLKVIDDEYIIEDCGMPQRMSHREIDKATGIKFAKHFERDGFEKTSEYKYDILKQTHQKVKVGEVYSSTTNSKYDKRRFCRYDSKGKEATLVVTGQPTVRKNTGKMGDGKGYEFIFLDSKKEIKIDKKVFENFKFAYFDKRTTQPKESPDWTYWKSKLVKGKKVPVFFQKKGNQIAHFGLSYLYKLPYNHSVKDGLGEAHFDSRLDLAQAIFGYVDKKEALKGRVQFSHFKANSNIKILNPRTEVLGTPRASYYPMYVRQYNTDFKTFMDSNFHIAGWKRYPIHKGSNTTQTEDTENENIGTTFAPLGHGVVFKGKLKYHNLKKAELGAVLSALTFHNTSNTFHNIGMAKSLGYGKIELALHDVNNLNECLKAFEMEVSKQVIDWRESKQLQELLTMATEQNNSGSSKLIYMSLKKFADSKSSDKDYLRLYSELENINTNSVQTLLSTE